MKAAHGILAILALGGAAGPALAEDTICTPEYYYNSSETPPVVIHTDMSRMAGSRITRLDTETGAYTERIGAADGRVVATGKFAIVNPGSMQERIDFVALDAKSGLVIHLSFVDDGLPFTRLDAEGIVASGHCISEFDLPK